MQSNANGHFNDFYFSIHFVTECLLYDLVLVEATLELYRQQQLERNVQLKHKLYIVFVALVGMASIRFIRTKMHLILLFEVKVLELGYTTATPHRQVRQEMRDLKWKG